MAPQAISKTLQYDKWNILDPQRGAGLCLPWGVFVTFVATFPFVPSKPNSGGHRWWAQFYHLLVVHLFSSGVLLLGPTPSASCFTNPGGMALSDGWGLGRILVMPGRPVVPGFYHGLYQFLSQFFSLLPCPYSLGIAAMFVAFCRSSGSRCTFYHDCLFIFAYLDWSWVLLCFMWEKWGSRSELHVLFKPFLL